MLVLLHLRWYVMEDVSVLGWRQWAPADMVGSCHQCLLIVEWSFVWKETWRLPSLEAWVPTCLVVITSNVLKF